MKKIQFHIQDYWKWGHNIHKRHFLQARVTITYVTMVDMITGLFFFKERLSADEMVTDNQYRATKTILRPQLRL